MVLIGAYAMDTARRLLAAVDGEKSFSFSIDRCLALAEELTPDQIIVSARLGGTAQRTVEWIPEMLKRSPDADVVLASFSPGVDEIREAVDLGAYGVIDMDTTDFYRKLDRIILASVGRRRACAASLACRRRMAH